MNSKTKLVKNIVTDVFQSFGSCESYDWDKAYVEAIGVGLRLAGIKYEKEKVVEIQYKGHYVGKTKVDFLAHFGQEKVVIQTDRFYSQLKNPAYKDEETKRCMKELGAEKGLLVLHGRSFESRKNKPKLVIRELSH